MEHLVRYQTAAGETRYETTGSLEAAVELVERLRNEDNASDAQVFRPVPIEFKAYYKVVVAEGSDAGVPQAAPAIEEPPPGAMPLTPPRQPPVQVHDSAPGDADADDPPAEEDGARRSSLFGRGG